MAFRDMELYDPDGEIPRPAPPAPAGGGPRRGPVVAVVLVLLVVIAGVAWRVHASGSPEPSPGGTSAPPAVTAAPSSASFSPTTTKQPAAASPEQAAEGFVTAWARPNEPEAQWLAAVRPYATSEFATRLLSVDPANVPATTVTGRPGAAHVAGETAAVQVPTDAGSVTVTLQKIGQRWLVSGITPTRATEKE